MEGKTDVSWTQFALNCVFIFEEKICNVRGTIVLAVREQGEAVSLDHGMHLVDIMNLPSKLSPECPQSCKSLKLKISIIVFKGYLC